MSTSPDSESAGGIALLVMLLVCPAIVIPVLAFVAVVAVFGSIGQRSERRVQMAIDDFSAELAAEDELSGTSKRRQPKRANVAKLPPGHISTANGVLMIFGGILLIIFVIFVLSSI